MTQVVAQPAESSADAVRAAQVWQGVLARLAARLNAQVFRTWMAPVRALGLAADGALTLGVPSQWHLDWVRDHYQSVLDEALAAEVPTGKVKLVIVADLAAAPPEPAPLTRSQASLPPPGATGAPATARPRPVSNLNHRYTLDNFVAGPSNQLARAAAQAVADNPARAYNPLFIFGGVGLGKTHLLHAIGNRVCALRPEWNVLYLSAEDFANDLISCLQGGRMEAFRARYRTHCDVLLLDDVHFIGGKDRTQEEFFHSFNHLHALGKQVVVTSDRFPHQMDGVEERLRTRLQWGLIADIQPPEIETRLAILRQKAQELGLPLPDDVAQFLAVNLKQNVRELEGALVRLAAASSLEHCELTLEMARTRLRDVVLRGARMPTCHDVIQHVSAYYNVSVADLRGNRRHRGVTTPRHMAMYLCRKHTSASFPEIGSAFGGKDHTTVMASVRKVDALVASDPAVAAVAAELAHMLEG